MEEHCQPSEKVSLLYCSKTDYCTCVFINRNGVVKFECVMKLKEQLDKLGKMKGITQDEKGI